MTLLTICQNVLQEIGEYDVPSSFINNSDDATAVQILALANSVGRYLSRRYRLTDLLETHTFNTADGTDNYALPAGFRQWAPLTHWDNANDWKMIGPASNAQWQRLQSSGIVATERKHFRIAKKRLYIFPTPSAVEEMTYQYYSEYWCEKAADNADQISWVLDSDNSRIDDYLMEREIKWRFLSSKGLPYEEEKMEAESIRASHLADDGSAAEINLADTTVGVIGHSLPETGYGT